MHPSPNDPTTDATLLMILVRCEGEAALLPSIASMLERGGRGHLFEVLGKLSMPIVRWHWEVNTFPNCLGFRAQTANRFSYAYVTSQLLGDERGRDIAVQEFQDAPASEVAQAVRMFALAATKASTELDQMAEFDADVALL
jgi:hypothetical protein